MFQRSSAVFREVHDFFAELAAEQDGILEQVWGLTLQTLKEETSAEQAAGTPEDCLHLLLYLAMESK